MRYKGEDKRFKIRTLVETGRLVPVEVSDKLRRKFIWSYMSLPVKAVLIGLVLCIAAHFALGYVNNNNLLIKICAAMIAIAILLFLIAVWHVLYTAIKIVQKDYKFYEGEIADKYNKGYMLLGLEDRETDILFGKKHYDPGDKVIVARMGTDLSIISE